MPTKFINTTKSSVGIDHSLDIANLVEPPDRLANWLFDLDRYVNSKARLILVCGKYLINVTVPIRTVQIKHHVGWRFACFNNGFQRL